MNNRRSHRELELQAHREFGTGVPHHRHSDSEGGDWSIMKPMTTKTFDAVLFMRKRREEIDREDAALSWQEQAAKTMKLLLKDPLWRRLRKSEHK